MMSQNFFRILVLLFSFLAVSTASAQANDPLAGSPPAASVSPSAPANDPLAGSPSAASVSPSVPTPSVAATVGVYKYYSPWFDIALWIGAIGIGGIGSFFWFLRLHKKDSVKRDWMWPVIPALFLGYLFVMAPMILSNGSRFYEDWSENCFKSITYGDSRDPNFSGEKTRMCVEAQTGVNEDDSPKVSHSALGVNKVFRLYKETFAGGLGNPMYPWEMHFIIWILMAFYGCATYFLLLNIRRRFFV
jgi:hypothetical protein